MEKGKVKSMTGKDFISRFKMVFQIFARDVNKLSHNIVAIVVIMGICVIPALYAWFNIAANWDPYGKTEGIKVAVVSEDKGYTLEGITINLGEDITQNLKANSDMGWTFLDNTKEAINGVKSGDYYAAVVVSETFSQDLASILTEDLKRPQIKYYVNEKKNAIAPKITDKGIEAIKGEVNSQFIDTVTTSAASLLETAEDGAETTQSQVMNNLLKRMEEMDSALAAFDNSVAAFNSTAQAVSGVIEANRQLLPGLDTAMTSAQGLGNSSLGAINSTQEAMSGLNAIIGQLASSNATVIANAEDMVNKALNSAAEDGAAAGQDLAEAAQEVTAVIDLNNNLLSIIQGLGSDMGVDVTGAADALNKANQDLDNLLSALENGSNTLINGGVLASGEINSLNTAMTTAKNSIDSADAAYNTTVKTQLDQAVQEVTASINSMNSVFQGMAQEIPQIDSALGSTTQALDSMGQGLASAQDLIAQGRNILAEDKEKLENLAADNRFAMFIDTVMKNPQALGAFMAEPVDIATTALYPVENYGSAMTPFYSTLAFWVGGIVMAALLKTKVAKDDKIKGFGPATSYLGRSLLFLAISFIQATIICLGDLLFLEIQCEHPFLFMLAGWVSALVYTFIIYTLTVSFNDIGKALCVILLVLQIAGTGGTFPIEVIPDFFQGIAPFLPFTYGISALREAVAGLYGYTFLIDILRLLAFVPFALILGLFLRKPLTKFNEFYENRLEDTDLM